MIAGMRENGPVAGRPSVVCPVLIGRDAELQHALRRWNQVLLGHGAFLLLSGEAGIGKSRLLAEFSALVTGQASGSDSPGAPAASAPGAEPRVLTATTFARDSEMAGSVILAISDAARREPWGRAAAAVLRDRLLASQSESAAHAARHRRVLARADARTAGTLPA